MGAKITNEQFVELWNSDEPTRSIAETLGIRADNVRKKANRLRNRGFDLRYRESYTTQAEKIDQKLQGEAPEQRRLRLLEANVKKQGTYIKFLEGKQTLWDFIGDSFLEAVESMPPVPIPALPVLKTPLSREELFLVISDVHLGEWVKEADTGGLGSYNLEIFIERMEVFRRAIADIIRYHVPRYKRLRILFEGDIIAGHSIFKHQHRFIEQELCNQIWNAVEYFTGFIVNMLEIFEEIVCECIPGNHGRVGEKGESSPSNNFDTLAYRFIDKRFENTDRVTFNISDSWFKVIEVNGIRIAMEHGEDIRRHLRFPYYSADRVYGELQKIYGAFDYLVVGHHHVAAMIQGLRIIFNGCWPGPGEYSLKTLKSWGDASQIMFSLDPNYGITWMRDIKLMHPKWAREDKFAEIAGGMGSR